MSAALLLILATCAPSAAGDPALRVAQTLVLPRGTLAHRLVDWTGDGRRDLITVGERGEVRSFTWDERAGALVAPAPPLVLADPGRTLLDLADLPDLPDLSDSPDSPESPESPESIGGRMGLLVLSPRGLELYLPDERGVLAPEGTSLASDIRFDLRSGAPTFSRFAQDVNGDGRTDLVVPGVEACGVWLQLPEQGPPGESPVGVRFRLAAEVAIDLERWSTWDGDALSYRLESSFIIPSIQTADVNGDGRGDLWVQGHGRRGFHLQASDGTYASEPDVSLNLSSFRDTTPRSPFKPGRTLALSDRPHFEARDLDADGVLDFVIAHRRKVWVFHGSEAGPQFVEPSTVLKAAEDVTALTLAPLNDDPYDDLLLVKVQIPTVATILRGFFGEWDVQVTAVGYENSGARSFSTEPTWRSVVSVRLPAIMTLMRSPAQFIERFEEIDDRFRVVREGDVDGDGVPDVVLLNEGRLEVWLGRAGEARSDEWERDFLRRFFFGEGDRTLDLEGVYRWLAGLAQARAARLSGGRERDTSLELRPPGEWVLQEVTVGNVGPSGGDEILVEYRDGEGRVEFDLLEWSVGRDSETESEDAR